MSPAGPAASERVAGVVAEFEEDRGTGAVEDGQGRRIFFHCTAIADGSRSIAAGAAVSFLVQPGHLGRWEAADIRPRTA